MLPVLPHNCLEYSGTTAINSMQAHVCGHRLRYCPTHQWNCSWGHSEQASQQVAVLPAPRLQAKPHQCTLPYHHTSMVARHSAFVDPPGVARIPPSSPACACQHKQSSFNCMTASIMHITTISTMWISLATLLVVSHRQGLDCLLGATHRSELKHYAQAKFHTGIFAGGGGWGLFQCIIMANL